MLAAGAGPPCRTDGLRAQDDRCIPISFAPPWGALTDDTIKIDAPTLRGLKVLTSPFGPEGSLLSVMDRTVTAAGSRLLLRHRSTPLTTPQTVARRSHDS
ncbi:MAG: hypothetical protein ACRYHQ_31410 [Janthinobacterium lividum]